MSLPTGTRLGPYEIVSQIGAGGMGEVYKARDTRLHRIVAIKVLREGVSVGRARLRLEREARAIASVTHSNICALYDIGFENGAQYLVIEYVDGETLADRIRRGPMSPGEVVRMALEVAHALEAAHAQGLVHRDLKPGNIMVTREGTKLLDFGLAKVCSPVAELSDETEEGPLTAEGTVVGTPAYMAPEQLHARDVDGRADIFALGAILYEALTGRRAFGHGGSASDANPQAMSSIRPDVPAALVRIIETCLARDRAARWQSAREVVVQLQALETIPAMPIRRTRPRMRILAATAALVVAIAAIAAAIHFRPETAKLTRHGTNDPEAYRLYLQARHYHATPNEASQRAALNLYQAAIHRDPTYAAAYAGVSHAYATLSNNDWNPQDEYRTKQKEYAQKALALDDSLSEAHTALGRIHMGIVEHDYSAAEKEFRKAIALNPQDAETHLFYGIMLDLNRRFAEAERETKTAVNLDSTITGGQTALMQINVDAGDCARAKAEARRVIEQNPVSAPAYQVLGLCAEKNGRFDEAVLHQVRNLDLRGVGPEGQARLRNAYASGGMVAFWREHLAMWHEAMSRGERISAYRRAALEMKALHDDAALDWLQQAIEARENPAAWMNVDSVWDPVRDTPRFQALRRRIGFK
jgi:tRNA A-37 threonylcarbamoyl transferase component Bud32/Tfp pilus assembly protein PilF